jgi:hypothetical protein
MATARRNIAGSEAWFGGDGGRERHDLFFALPFGLQPALAACTALGATPPVACLALLHRFWDDRLMHVFFSASSRMQFID